MDPVNASNDGSTGASASDAAGMRSKTFKHRALTPEELRSRRVETTIEIRKAKRGEHLLKRRNVDKSEGPDRPDDANMGEGRPEPAVPAQAGAGGSKVDPELIQGVYSSDLDVRFNSVLGIRKLLSRQRDSPISEVVAHGLVPRLVEILADDSLPGHQFEAAWALTNVASGTTEHTQAVLQAGAVPLFVRLLDVPAEELRDQSVWALGNIAGESPAFRDFVTQCGILAPLLRLLTEPKTKLETQRNGVWALSNLCRGKNPPPDLQVVVHTLPTIARLLYAQDTQILVDVCWALTYISDLGAGHIQSIIDAGVTRRLVELLRHHRSEIQVPALRTLGNITSSTDMHTQVVLNHGLLTFLGPLLSHANTTVRKEACWTISNVMAGNRQQIEQALPLLPGLLQIVKGDTEKVRKEAAYAVCNVLSGKVEDHLRYFVRQGGISPLGLMCHLQADADLLRLLLLAFENLLQFGEREGQRDGQGNTIADHMEEAGVVERIEKLQEHENQEVYELAYRIITVYFGLGEDDDPMLQPVVANNHYEFTDLTDLAENPRQKFSF